MIDKPCWNTFLVWAFGLGYFALLCFTRVENLANRVAEEAWRCMLVERVRAGRGECTLFSTMKWENVDFEVNVLKLVNNPGSQTHINPAEKNCRLS